MAQVRKGDNLQRLPKKGRRKGAKSLRLKKKKKSKTEENLDQNLKSSSAIEFYKSPQLSASDSQLRTHSQDPSAPPNFGKPVAGKNEKQQDLFGSLTRMLDERGLDAAPGFKLPPSNSPFQPNDNKTRLIVSKQPLRHAPPAPTQPPPPLPDFPEGIDVHDGPPAVPPLLSSGSAKRLLSQSDINILVEKVKATPTLDEGTHEVPLGIGIVDNAHDGNNNLRVTQKRALNTTGGRRRGKMKQISFEEIDNSKLCDRPTRDFPLASSFSDTTDSSKRIGTPPLPSRAVSCDGIQTKKISGEPQPRSVSAGPSHDQQLAPPNPMPQEANTPNSKLSKFFGDDDLQTDTKERKLVYSAQKKNKFYQGEKRRWIKKRQKGKNANLISVTVKWEERNEEKVFEVSPKTTPQVIKNLYVIHVESETGKRIEDLEDYGLLVQGKEDVGFLSPDHSLLQLNVVEKGKLSAVMLFDRTQIRVNVCVEWMFEPLTICAHPKATIKSVLKRVYGIAEENGVLLGTHHFSDFGLLLPGKSDKEPGLLLDKDRTWKSYNFPGRPVVEFINKPRCRQLGKLFFEPTRISKKKVPKERGKKSKSKEPEEEPERFFGTEVTDIPEHDWCDDRGFKVPKVLAKLREIMYELDGCSKVGIFRLSGNEAEMDDLKKQLNTDFDNATTNNHDNTATLIKRWYGSCPTKIFQLLPKGEFEKCLQDQETCTHLDEQLPEPYRSLFLWLCEILLDTAEFSETNKMFPNNLAICCAPNMISEDAGDNPMAIMAKCDNATSVLTQFLEFRLANRHN
eukprot:CAMPEP_0174252752 /NCGR_PEP_ID=MMETSP0439-20130205/2121_1 /TAXON_ID=0 /ORGANISM="Stereomyxa ramosa, Strain Chinc5" /LENGTH=790 /DNA_ID=CAMNT_0015333361 /DNA_START=105 /DNA_END=2477 /DNA_ORIENTATION=-